MKINKQHYFNFFSGIQITKGYTKSIMLDLRNGRYKEVPNDLISVLTQTEIIFSDENQELLNHLSENNWGHYTDVPEQFNSIELNFEIPNLIENCIIDIDLSKKYDVKKVINELSNLGCSAFQLRFYNSIEIEKLKPYKEMLDGSGAQFIEFIFSLKDENDVSKINKLDINYHIYNYKQDVPLENNPLITFSKTDLKPHENCGFVNKFSINMKHYLESQNFNTCLNKKVGIDVAGNIKNCPSDKNIYGNVKNDSIKDIVLTEKFKKKWNISKNQINECNVCEYRNICTDCRVFTKNNKTYEKPSKCKYNPIIGKWD